jgi:uncharacterized protein YkwD
MFTAVIVFSGAFLFDFFNIPEQKQDNKQSNETSQQKNRDDKTEQDLEPYATKEGVRTLIGTNAEKIRAEFGEPDRIDPSAYGYDWWIYRDNWQQYMQIGIDGSTVVTILAYGKKLNNGPFEIGGKREDVLTHASPASTVSFEFNHSSYRFELSEEELNKRPLMDLGKNGWAVLYFDEITKTLSGIRYLDSETLLKQKPYALVYRGKLVQPGKMSREEWEKVESGAEKQILDLTNLTRRRFELEPLEWDEETASVAFLHSKEMAEKNYFSHHSPTAGDLGNRLSEGGVAYLIAGENIAAKYTDAAAVVQGWLNSKGHRKNLLKKGYTHLGIGVYEKYYTQNFLKTF